MLLQIAHFFVKLLSVQNPTRRPLRPTPYWVSPMSLHFQATGRLLHLLLWYWSGTNIGTGTDAGTDTGTDATIDTDTNI